VKQSASVSVVLLQSNTHLTIRLTSPISRFGQYIANTPFATNEIMIPHWLQNDLFI